MKKLIVDARVTMVSLCRRGKNTLKTLYKGEGGARLQALVKASAEFDERGQLLAVVAAPNLEDADGDTFESPEAIERAAHHFLRAGADLDLHHDLQPLKKDDAFVAESFVIQKGDSRFADWSDYEGHKVDVTGGWGMVIQIDDPTLRKSYRDGEWDGVSLYAPVARMRTVAKADTSIASELRKVFEDAGIINPQTDEDFDMDAKELAEVLKASNTELVKAVVAAVTPAAPKKEDAKDEIAAPIFKGDPTDPKALLAHKHAIEVHRLMTSGDLNDPAKLDELLKKAEASNVKPEDSAESEELRKARARVAELEKGSNQNVSDKPAEGEHPFVTAKLVKASDAHLLKSALAAAKMLNDERAAKAAR